MGNWTSLNDIITTFELNPASSIEEVRTSLSSNLKKLHPDQTGGKFANADAEAAYYKTFTAYHKLEEIQERNQSLVPFSESKVARWVPPVVDIRSNEIQLRKVISKSAEHKYRAAKIRSAVIAVAITSTMAFSGKLVENPLVSNLLSFLDAHLPILRPVLEGAFVVGILAACAAFSAAWKHEMKARSLSEEMLTELNIQTILLDKLKSKITDEGVFSFNSLVAAIQSDSGYVARSWVGWIPPNVSKKLPFSWRYRRERSLFDSDIALAQQAAELIVAKLEARQAISPTPAGGFRREFQLSSAALDQLNDDGTKPSRRKASVDEPIF